MDSGWVGGEIATSFFLGFLANKKYTHAKLLNPNTYLLRKEMLFQKIPIQAKSD